MICTTILQKMLKARFDTSDYELEGPLHKKVIGLMKDELGGNIITKFVGLKAKSYSYLIDGGSEDKKSKGHKKVCHEKKT